MTRCRDCDQQLWHCHGTLVLHPDGSAECTDPGCPDPRSPHSFRIDCTEISAACCQEPGSQRFGPAGRLARGA